MSILPESVPITAVVEADLTAVLPTVILVEANVAFKEADHTAVLPTIILVEAIVAFKIGRIVVVALSEK